MRGESVKVWVWTDGKGGVLCAGNVNEGVPPWHLEWLFDWWMLAGMVWAETKRELVEGRAGQEFNRHFGKMARVFPARARFSVEFEDARGGRKTGRRSGQGKNS